MAYSIIEPRIGVQQIGAISDSSAPSVIPGTIVRAQDPVYGHGEFIYLPALSAQIVGSLVNYDSGSGVAVSGSPVVTLNPNTAGLARPVAVSMAANAAGTTKYGWFCIQGTVPAKKTATKVNPKVAMFQSATAGRIMSTTASGKQILGARSMNTATVASATSTVLLEVNRPHMQGQTV